MTDFVSMVTEFHKKYKHPVDGPMTEESLKFRYRLLAEELKEVYDEIYDDQFNVSVESINRKNLTKELADILYVTVGFAVSFGLPLEKVFEAVHKSNMTKTGNKREDGKVLKGPDYQPPDFIGLFNE